MKCGTNLILVFLIVFFKPQLSTSPKLFADMLDDEFFRCKDLHCWWPLGWVPEAINPIRSRFWVVALGHLFLVFVFFLGGALVWHCLKDILEGFLSWLWSDPFFITCTRLGEDLLDLSGVRETVGLLDIMEWSNRRWAKLQHRHFSLCRWKSYLDPPDLKWGLPILSDSMKSSPKFFSKLERIFKH